jgi:glycerate dehydrogenase
MKIVVLDGYALNPGDNPWSDLAHCGELSVFDRSTTAEIEHRAANADILITNKAPIPGTLIEALPDLKFISVLATGYNIVDVAAAAARKIPVSNAANYGTDTVAQYVMGMMLELCLHIGEHGSSVAQGNWTSSVDWTYWHKPLIELRGKTLGIVGFGRIGRRVAELATAFGMRVILNTRTHRAEAPFESNFESNFESKSLNELFSEADFISLHCGLTPDNMGMVNRGLLQSMKCSAFLINTARGALINETDLAQELNAGTLAGAALDVLSTEPPSADNPLLYASNCIITPHIAWAALAARQRIMQITVDNVRAFLAGKPINTVPH